MTFPALTYGHDAYGKDRFWISTGPADKHIAHISYTVEYSMTKRSVGNAGPKNAEAWAKLFAAAPEMAALLLENFDSAATPDGWLDRVGNLLQRTGMR